MSAPQYRIGVDVGGTFTDLVAAGEAGGAVFPILPGPQRAPSM